MVRRRLETQRQGVGVMMSGRPTYGKVLTVFTERERDESEDSWRALVGERWPIRKPTQRKDQTGYCSDWRARSDGERNF